MKEKRIVVHEDLDLHAIVGGKDYGTEERVLRLAGIPILGKLYLVLNYPELLWWLSDKVMASKMPSMYMVARDAYESLGIQEDLLGVALKMFSAVGGKKVSTKLSRLIQRLCPAWHTRLFRHQALLEEPFRNGKTVVDIGCGCGIGSIWALIAYGDKNSRLVLVDNSSKGIDLAKELVSLYADNGYRWISDRIEFVEADLQEYSPPADSAIISIGCLLNYFSRKDAFDTMKKWLYDCGAERIIADAVIGTYSARLDTKMLISAIKHGMGWKIAPEENDDRGRLRFYKQSDIEEKVAEYGLCAEFWSSDVITVGVFSR